MPHDVYMQVVYIVRDYHRMLKERNNILYSSAYSDGQPKSNQTADTTAQKAVKLAALTDRIDGIDRAVHDVNAHYQAKVKRADIQEPFSSFEAFERGYGYGYFCYMLTDPETGRQPSERTWRRFRQMLADEIAGNLNLF